MTESPFSAKLPSLQLAWDSVSSGLAKECWRKYQLVMLDGWTSGERSVDLDFGIFLHEGREAYYIARENLGSHEAALEHAVRVVLTNSWDERSSRPWQGDERKNRFTLIRTLVWYLDEVGENDPLITLNRADGKPMVEFSFRFGLGITASTDEEFVLCGHLDRVGDYSGQWWINDLKSTKYALTEESRGHFFASFTPDNQISLYTYAGQIVLTQRAAGVMLDGAQVAQGFSRFARAPITRTQSQVDEWLSDFTELLEQADKHAQRAYWPMNDKSCFRCEFRRVCSLPPNARKSALEKNFAKRNWNPLQVRGE